MAYTTTKRAEPYAHAFRTLSLLTGIGLSWGFAVISTSISPASADSRRPKGSIEIQAPEPAEISGVAAVPGGYAVVGDDTHDHGRLWPSGGRWSIPKFKKDLGPESVDVGVNPQGETLWLVLGEDSRTLADLSGGSYEFPKRYKEVCGRGLEGLALRWNDGGWEVAALSEGGFYKKKCAERLELEPRFVKPRVALLRWVRGEGTQGIDREFELNVEDPGDGQRFRAPDLVWNGDKLLVLLGSLDQEGRVFEHTWLQDFGLDGKTNGDPLKLEEAWGTYRGGKTREDSKNWEALDWSLDGARLVMGFDGEKGRQFLVEFPYP